MSLRGQAHPKAKLTDANIREIRRRRGLGETLSKLATAFGVVPGHISSICKGRRRPDEAVAVRGSLAEIADRHGLTMQEVLIIEQRALEKLRVAAIADPSMREMLVEMFGERVVKANPSPFCKE